MNEEMEKHILDELRQQTQFLKKVRRDNLTGMLVAALVLGVFLATLPLHQRFFSRLAQAGQKEDSWEQARTLHSASKDVAADSMVRRLVRKYPDYYYGHALLACWQQQLGNLKEAESEYAKAYDLFPSEDNEKVLVAIRKAIENKNKTANKASDAIGAEAAPQHQR